MYPKKELQQLNLKRELTKRLTFVKQSMLEVMVEFQYVQGNLAELPDFMKRLPDWAKHVPEKQSSGPKPGLLCIHTKSTEQKEIGPKGREADAPGEGRTAPGLRAFSLFLWYNNCPITIC
ncbi:MAG TPA: hypothetical protein VL357_06670 [Rariglobus sp.]|jgi:hypothetical protein|nr:hypothetical protein [Rariglobus sp.]